MCIVVLEFCCSEQGELLTMRLKMLCEDRCEDIAVNLAAACVRSLRRSDRLRSLSESHHVHYMIDVYIVLLFKLKRTQDIFAQVSIDRNKYPIILPQVAFDHSFKMQIFRNLLEFLNFSNIPKPI